MPGPAGEHKFPLFQVSKTITFYSTPRHLDASFLHENYVENGLSIAQISDLISSSKTAVRKGLDQAGIEIREPHHPHNGRKSQPRYGEKLVKGKTVGFKQERNVVKAIIEMKSNGLSLRQIASTLTTMKIPTKLRGQKWHPMMVSRVLQGNHDVEQDL